MAEAYPLSLVREVGTEYGKVTVVGNVDGVHDRGIFINDTTGRCKLMNVPKSLSGLIEIWGDVLGSGEVDCKGFTQFNDTNFDFESHQQIIEYMRKFKDVY
jgi:hypothetical protein